ncbi:hypothetical protein F3Y22_tig00116962pilonHSYRG00037 [Hibiscus syriacus]|uniref:RING-type domain-containing protein n=1 Tax=Hibiscus syriacus TaxID=106335 RepID=A0A6A2WKI7_HIBSY|nr:nucleolin-like [Hibiscus syriacus]KAE8659311.1 hypothetical protein F3Y22_tig00116962pilonHSYRG00037 [Hibiscus syriacus]
MSAADNGRNNPVQPRMLLDIIKDDRSIKDKKSWKTFRDKLRLKRAGSAWTSSVRVPASDVNVHTSRPRSSPRGPRCSKTADTNHAEDRGEHVSASNPKDGPRSKSLKPLTMVRHPSGRISSKNADEDDDVDDNDDDDYGSSGEEDGSEESPVEAMVEEKRSLSAREAVVAQEAAEAAAAAAAGTEEPVKMSLMDLLGETGYGMGEDEENDEEEDEEEDNAVESSRGGMEYTCCVCMVRHKGSAFIPCAHTFCRLCSRELMVQRGNCPLCHGYILEILDIF